ncbi:MAG: L-threonylcarbamoyladenylate synthase [Acidobacteriota bacterium]
MTQAIHLDPEHPQQEAIERAASIIRNGGLVAFPTETVYGLGADAMNQSAVEKIFEAKGRPADNPLIVHVSSRDMVDLAASGVSKNAERLMDKFWPGPLTLVLERKPEVAPSASAGLSTVAVRMPRNTIALALIRSSRTPIAAPSANASGRPSPTTAAHVLEDLGGRIDMILDGGTTNIGIESTVLDMTSDPPMILRPGWITREMLMAVIGPVEQATSGEELRRSPGTRHRHYSPRAQVILVEHGSAGLIEGICKEHLKEGSVGLVGHSAVAIDDPNLSKIRLENSAKDYAHSIYAALRELDDKNTRVVVVEGISEAGEGAAVMDRLRRAAWQDDGR